MAELVSQHRRLMAGAGGREYDVRIFGKHTKGMWVAAVEFHPLSGGLVLRTDGETTHPSRDALVHWATNPDHQYLERAFARAFDYASRE